MNFGVFMMVQRWRISSNSQLARQELFVPVWCLWWFKDEEFQAIHNTAVLQTPLRGGVYDGSKMKNFKQFTTGPCPGWPSWWCLWWFKDEEFQAIHNTTIELLKLNIGVYDGSKMKNFKQFTTRTPVLWHALPVFMMVQRWRISSNSQLLHCLGVSKDRCLWWFKDEEFQAIHNTEHLEWYFVPGVYDGSKMKNFKQFTTAKGHDSHMRMVFMMVQRWRISSNSQPFYSG